MGGPRLLSGNWVLTGYQADPFWPTEIAVPANNLQQLLQDLEDTRELVLGDETAAADGLHGAWRAAHEEATLAFGAWRLHGGSEAYAVYLAAEDRADAALDALAASR